MANKSNRLTAVLSYLAVVHVPVTILTWRDLKTRPDDQVRGKKAIWRLASAVNTTGSLAYWLIGRRRPDRHLLAVVE